MPEDLRSLFKEETIAAPGAFNAASAMLIEKAGFKALYISGAGLSNSAGLPDTGLLSRDNVANFSSYIINSVKVPVIVDVDTGFGGPTEVKKTVAAFEEIGAAAIHMEDQEFPKRCGHLPGKSVIPAKDFVKKIRAAVNARKDKGFLIIARTDARAVTGLNDAIERAKMYMEAGADMIFPEALENKEEFMLFSEAVRAPLAANMTEFGRTPYVTLDEFKGMGYSIVLFPMTCFRVAMKSLEAALAELRKKGTQKGLIEKMMTREELYRLLKYTFEQ